MKLVHLLLTLQAHAQARVYPSYYAYPGTSAMKVNGSSSSGHCAVSTTRYFDNGDIGNYTCTYPTTSVLFDGNIPTLTGLDGDMWASQLLTLLKTDDTTKIILDFTETSGYAGVRGMEVVLFNCPEWGIAVESIRIREVLASKEISNITSCDSLLKVCLTISPTSSQEPFFSLEFASSSPGMNWTHLAEITFLDIGSYCHDDAIHIATQTTGKAIVGTILPFGMIGSLRFMSHAMVVNPDELINHLENTATTSSEDTGPTSCSCEEVCPSQSSLAAILGSSIPLTILAIMATVIFTVNVIAVCKYRSKFKVRYYRTELTKMRDDDDEEEGVEVEHREKGEEDDHMHDEIPVHVLAHKKEDFDKEDTRGLCEDLQAEHTKDSGPQVSDVEVVNDGPEEMAPYVLQSNNAYGVKLESGRHNAYENVMEFI